MSPITTPDGDLTEVRQVLAEAEALLIGASNGLSISEGLNLFAADTAFAENFGDLAAGRGIVNLVQAMMYPWPTFAENWAFWARLAKIYMLDYTPTPTMTDLRAIADGKPCFVVTSNGEGHFERSGFDPERVLEVEGNWFTMQCSQVCHTDRYPAEDVLASIAEASGPIESLVPVCPRCGAPMVITMAAGSSLIPDTAAQDQFGRFLDASSGRRLVVLELGIGWRNQLIKRPLMELVAREPQARYITVNMGELFIPEQIADRSWGIDGGITEFLAAVHPAAR